MTPPAFRDGDADDEIKNAIILKREKGLGRMAALDAVEAASIVGEAL